MQLNCSVERVAALYCARNGWPATAGEGFIAIASNLFVIDLLSKDETVPSVIARLSGRFVCSSRSQSISIARSGLIVACKNTEPTLIPLASNSAISEKNVR
jgi:hypothetical protein